MVTRKQKVRLAIFLILMFGAVIALLFLIFGRGVMEKKVTYYVRFEETSVSGLSIGSSVTYQGINVGNVENIYIDPESVRDIVVIVKVNKDLPIRENTKALLLPAGITGVMKLELAGGKGDSPSLEPGSTIKASRSTIDMVTASAERILEEFEALLANFSALISEENQKTITSLLNNIDSIVGSNEASIARVIGNTEEMTVELLKSLEHVNGLLREVEQEVDAAEIGKLSAGLQKTLEETNKIIDQTNETVASMDMLIMNNQREIQDIINSLRRTTDNLYDFSLLIRDNPSLLLRGGE
jgi:phospholipid/cholesterol/gamma-HCH transport system substrate-binding protein